MNKSAPLLGLSLTLATLVCTACSKQPAPESKPAAVTPPPAAVPAPVETKPVAPAYTTLDQKVSYGIGFNVGSGLARERGVAIDQEAVKAGLADGLAGAGPKLTQAELQAAFMEVQQRAATAAAADAEKAKAVATEFLAKNKGRPGVTTTASGLQYEVITAGTGPLPKPTDMVEVHYHGTLVDGTVFDSSRDRGETLQFSVTGVIRGWIEALQLMPVGSKWKLYVHPDLGYGPRAAGKIPPNSALIFEVELISIKTPPAAAVESPVTPAVK